jgi:hypothetical protein
MEAWNHTENRPHHQREYFRAFHGISPFER